MRPIWALEDKNMQNENRNEEAVSPVIATILMVAITVVLAGVLYVWASQLAEGNTDGDFSMYDFSVTDASGTPTSAGEEALVFIAMDNGDDLSWASVIVQLSADDGVYTTCTNPNEAVDTGCAVGDNDDGSWTFGEEVTVSEGSSDICAGPCSVQVKVLDRSSNKLIYESTVVSVL
jgi:flagellin-like protein